MKRVLRSWGVASADNPGARQVVRRQLGTPDSLRLKIERSQRQKDDRAQDPSSNNSESGSKQSIEPLDFSKLDELLNGPDDQGTNDQRPQKNTSEAQE